MKKVKIIDLGMNGEGVARCDDKVVFVPFALPQEEVEIELVQDKSKFCIGKVSSIINASDSRVNPECPYFKVCGGCNLQHLDYNEQLKFKTNLVQNTLYKVGRIDIDVLPCVASKEVYNYRNKGAFPIDKTVGMFEFNSHNIVDINYCHIMNDTINQVLQIVKDWIKQFNINTFNFTTRKGLVKHLVVRSVNNQTLVCLVCSDYNIPNLNDLIEKLSVIGDFGLVLNKNNQNNSIILGKDFKHVYGLNSIEMCEFDVTYSIDIPSFMQVNNDIKLKLYEDVLNNIGGGTVIDAYAGAGLLSAIMTKVANKVISVEIVPEASNKARRLVSNNSIPNMEVINGDCTKIIPNLINRLGDISVVLDPPHSGCSDSVINAVKTANKIVYIACNPIALAKDLKELIKTHKIIKIQPYDMFPQTKHVETLALLEKI